MYLFGNYFTLSEVIKIGYSTIVTRIFYKNATLIRRPFYLRGKPRLQYGKGFTTGYNCRFEIFGEKSNKSKKLIIGENCKIGDNVHIVASDSVTIGDNCLMASKIFISDTSHGVYNKVDPMSAPDIAPDDRTLVTKPVVIGDNVWIGENVCVLLGARIGNGCIIGANSVVTGDIPDNSIVAGAPARVIKQYNTETNIWEKQNNNSPQLL